MVLRVQKFENGIFPPVVKGNHSHMVFHDTPLHVDAVTDTSNLPWRKYLKGEESKNSHPHNTPTSLSPAEDYMKVVTEPMAGLGNLSTQSQLGSCSTCGIWNLSIFLSNMLTSISRSA